MATEAGLIVSLEARLNKFEKDLKQAGKIADREVKNMENRFSRFQPTFGAGFGENFLKGFLGAFSVGAVLSGVREAIKGLDDLGDAAERLGVSTKTIQTLQFALGQFGGEAEDAIPALDKLSSKIGEAARGGGDLAEIFELNGISLRKANGEMKSTEDLLPELANLFAGVGSQQEKFRLAVELFGRNAGPKMVSVLDQIAKEGLPSLANQAERAGQIIDDKLIKKAGELDNQFKLIGTRFANAFKEFAVFVGPFVIKELQNIQIALRGIGQELELLKAGEFRKTFFPTDFELGVRKLKAATGIAEELGGQAANDFYDAFGNRFKQGPKEEDKPKRVTILPSVGAKEFKQAAEQAERHIALMKAETDAVGLSAGAHARLRVETELLQVLQKNGVTDLEAYKQRIADIGLAAEEAANKLAARQHTFQEIQGTGQELGNILADAFKGATIEGQKFDEVLSNIANRLSSRAIDKVFDLFFAAPGTGGASVFTGLFQSIFGGQRQAGGPTSAGKSYLVGEKGPELFIPRVPGMVTPTQVNSSDRSPGNFNVNLRLNLTGANGDETIARIAREESKKGVQQAVAIANATAPGRQMRYSQLGT